MKKNKNGFMLAEIIIVSSIIMIALVSLFTLVSKVFLRYEERIVYNDVDATYVSRGLAENFTEDLVKNDFTNEETKYLEFDTEKISISNSDSFKTFIQKNNVVKSFIVRYNKDYIEEVLNIERNNIEQKFYDYIELYKENNDFSDSLFNNVDENKEIYNYIIFTAISNNCDDEGVCIEDNGNISFGYYKFKFIKVFDNYKGSDDQPPIVYDMKFQGKNGKESDSTGWITWRCYDYHGNVIKKIVIKGNSKSVNVVLSDTENKIYKIEGKDVGDNIYDLDGDIFKLDIKELDLGNGPHDIEVYAIDELDNSGGNSCTVISSAFCAKKELIIGKLKIEFNLEGSIIEGEQCAYHDWGEGFDPDTETYKGAEISFYLERKKYAGDPKTCRESGYDYSSTWIVKDKNSGRELKSGVMKSKTGTDGSQSKFNATNFVTLDEGDDLTEIVVISIIKKTEKEDDGCLAEGTKILLANGKYKNIEDIDHNDLLTVFDHENGIISYQYPSWIETQGIDNNYILITFDDNTELKVVKDHGIYSLDYNEYVRINDRDKFKVGSRVVKLNNGKLEEVKVKSIEVIEEEVKYYFMFTNRHFNLITNDILTGSPDVFIYNFHGFNNDLTWKTPLIENDIYSYEELSEVPYYLYKGMRLYEGKYFNNYGMNKEGYLNFLRSTIINDNRTVKPELNENGKREWMVTTSEDVVTEENKLSYLMEEGDYYTLKEPINKTINNKRFIGWLHTGENIMYKTGDKVKVLYGTHFVAKYQDLFENFNGSDKFEKIK